MNINNTLSKISMDWMIFLQFKILICAVIKYLKVILVMFVKLLDLITVDIFKIAQTLLRATWSDVGLSGT